MTFKPPAGPFDTLIQELLGNIQRNADATMKRLGEEREERLIGEERQFQAGQAQIGRDFTAEQADLAHQRSLETIQYQHDLGEQVRVAQREEQLTDQAHSTRAKLIEGIHEVMPFLALQGDRAAFSEAQRLLAELSRPMNLTGQDAIEYVDSLMADLGDGRVLSALGALAEWKASSRTYTNQEEWGLKFVSDMTETIANTKEGSAERLALAQAIYHTPLLSDDQKRMLLGVAGIENAHAMSMQEIELNMQRRADERDRLFTERYPEILDLEVDTAKAQLREYHQRHGHSDVEAFLASGVLPVDEDDRAALAAALGRTPEQLEAMSSTRLMQVMAMQKSETRLAALAAVQAGVKIDLDRVDLKAKRYALERDQLMDRVKDAQEAAEWVFAAAKEGDVESLQLIKALQGTGVYEHLDRLHLDDLIEVASEIRGDEELARMVARRALAIGNRESLEAYIDTFAEGFTLDNMTFDRATGSYVELEAAVEEALDTFNASELRAFGITADELRDRLRKAAQRVLFQGTQSEAAAALAALEASIPEGAEERRRWRASFEQHATLLGYDDDTIQALMDGLLDAATRDVTKWQAETTRTWQEADRLFQETLGFSLANIKSQFELEALLLGAKEGMSLEGFKTLHGMFNANVQSHLDMVNSPACSVPGSEAMWADGQYAVQFQPDAGPGCKDALERANAGREMIDLLAEMAIFGDGGSVTFGFGGGGGESAARPVASGYNTAREQPAVTPRDLINTMLAAGRPDEDARGFLAHEDKYLSLPADLQEGVYQAALSGASAEDLGDMIDFGILAIAGESGFVPQASSAPTLEEIGHPGSGPANDWLHASTDDQMNAVMKSREFQEEVWAAAASGALLDSWGDEQYARLARKYGVFLPLQAPAEPSAPAHQRQGLFPQLGRFLGEGISNVAESTRRDIATSMDFFIGAGPLHLSAENSPRVRLEEGGKLISLQPATDVMREAVRETSAAVVSQAEAYLKRRHATRPGGAGGVEVEEAPSKPALDLALGTPASFAGRGTPTEFGAGGAPASREELRGRESTVGVTSDGRALNLPPPERAMPETTATGKTAAFVSLADSVMPSLLIQESGNKHHDANSPTGLITSSAGALGIAQVMPTTAAAPGVAGVRPLISGYEGISFGALRENDPQEYDRLVEEIGMKMATEVTEEDHLRFARDYLAGLIAKFDGNIEHGLGSYNAGSGHVSTAVRLAREAGDDANWLDYLQTSPANKSQTINYVRNIMAMLEREARRARPTPQPGVSASVSGERTLPPLGASAEVGGARGIPDPGFEAFMNATMYGGQAKPLPPGDRLPDGSYTTDAPAAGPRSNTPPVGELDERLRR